ncbi:MAG TPA: histidine kinase [Solirubrobacteraceae bacterium]|nr:histidine kinase [Solirubrobacteraceae bacterium]
MGSLRRREGTVALPAEAVGLRYRLRAWPQGAGRSSSRLASELWPRRARSWITVAGLAVVLAVYLIQIDSRFSLPRELVVLLAGAFVVGLSLAIWLWRTRQSLSLTRSRNEQLAGELKASLAELAASRRRLVEAADAERQRIEQSLHDGAQQHLVGLRLRLELAIEAVREGSPRGVEMLAEIGAQMDAALEEVHNLARGIYPPLLAEHGIGEALRSVNRRSPWPASLDVDTIGRYSPDAEAAVYFCCLEALQNIAKHAGAGIGGTVRLWEEESRLRFEVRDEGVGFAADAIGAGHGLTNIHDRMAAAGGTASVISSVGHGTTFRGSVPIGPRVATRSEVG